MRGKKQFVARWSSLPGAFHDEDNMGAAIVFALKQHHYNSPESKWSVTDIRSGEVVANGP